MDIEDPGQINLAPLNGAGRERQIRLILFVLYSDSIWWIWGKIWIGKSEVLTIIEPESGSGNSQKQVGWLKQFTLTLGYIFKMIYLCSHN